MSSAQFNYASLHLADAAFAIEWFAWMSHIQLNYASLHFADAAFAALKKERMFFSKCKHFSLNILSFLCDSLLTHKKSTTPGNLMSETVPASAPPGMRLSCGQLCPWQKHRPKWQLRPRTLHTLKALGHFISVYYALFCVIKMPEIPLFIGHCEQYKTLWYFIIKCKKFKCLWEGF